MQRDEVPGSKNDLSGVAAPSEAAVAVPDYGASASAPSSTSDTLGVLRPAGDPDTPEELNELTTSLDVHTTVTTATKVGPSIAATSVPAEKTTDTSNQGAMSLATLLQPSPGFLDAQIPEAPSHQLMCRNHWIL